MSIRRRISCIVLAVVIIIGSLPIMWGVATQAPIKVGDLIEYGSYPQSRVINPSLINRLNVQTQNYEWTSYCYYSGDGNRGSMETGDWMMYCDTLYNGEKYRGVKILQYRPSDTFKPCNSSPNYQQLNGFDIGITYWFKWEPLQWRILDPSTGFVMSEKLIDSQAFCDTVYLIDGLNYNGIDGKNYATDYATSSIRHWLTYTFYNTAFSSSEQYSIQNTSLDNSAYDPKFSSISTTDKVYLLSANDMLNTSYGFSSSTSTTASRTAYATDYGKIQGMYCSSNGTAIWWLRNASKNTSGVAGIGFQGGYYYSVAVDSAWHPYEGIRPAMRLDPSILGLHVIIPYENTTTTNTTYKVKDIIEFGNYPQTKVTDSSTVLALNNQAKNTSWISYEYYSGDGNRGSMIPGDWMKYCDVFYNGSKYRGVRISKYRPASTFNACNSSPMYQQSNGYTTGQTYWFKWEPIKWRVLDPTTGLVMSEKLIDSQAFCDTVYLINSTNYNDAEGTNYATDYATSSIRYWLNNTFYNEAFSLAEKTAIPYVQLVNTAYDPKYDSINTTDKVFLLSTDDTLNTKYGFSTSTSTINSRTAYATDYGKSQGMYCNSNGSAIWWLRNAGNNSGNGSGIGFSGGHYASGVDSVWHPYEGIRPAINIDFEMMESTVDSGSITISLCVEENGIEKPVQGVWVECYSGTKLLAKEYSFTNTVTFSKNDLLKQQNNTLAINNLEQNISFVASKSLGGQVYLTSARGPFEYTKPNPNGTTKLKLCYVQFRPSISVAFDNTNHDLNETKSIMNSFVSEFYALTNGMVQVSVSGYKEIDNKGKIDKTNDKATPGDKLIKTDCDILIYDNATNCYADVEGYGSNKKHVTLGYKYQGSIDLGTAVICHEMLHYLFGVYDEYTTGYEGLNRDNNEQHPYRLDLDQSGYDEGSYDLYWVENIASLSPYQLYFVELSDKPLVKHNLKGIQKQLELCYKDEAPIIINPDGTLRGSIIKLINPLILTGQDNPLLLNDDKIFFGQFFEKYGTYWSQPLFNKPTNFGIMDDSITLKMSTPETYSYLYTEEFPYDKDHKSDHPESVTCQYYIKGESVSETVWNYLTGSISKEVSIYPSQTAISLEETIGLYSTPTEDNSTHEIISCEIVENENSALLNAALETTEIIRKPSFSLNNGQLTAAFSEESFFDNAVILLKRNSEDVIQRVNESELTEDISEVECIYIIGEKNGKSYYNQYVVEAFGTETSSATHVSTETDVLISRSADYEKFFVISNNTVIEADDQSSISRRFTFVSEAEPDDLVLKQFVSYQSGIDVSNAKVLFDNGVETTEITPFVAVEEGTSAAISFQYMGDGDYSIVAPHVVPSNKYTAPANLTIDTTDSVYEKEIHISFDDSNSINDIGSYHLYYSTSPITDVNADSVQTITLNPGYRNYTEYLSTEYGDYYFAIQAIGKDGNDSNVSDSVAFSLQPMDRNNDGLPETWVMHYGLSDEMALPTADSDGDGLSNLEEYIADTSPIDSDTDGDNVYDNVEKELGLNPLNSFSLDGVDDYVTAYGTPDLAIESLSFDEENIFFSVKNKTKGRAMRTVIQVSSSPDEVLAVWVKDIEGYQSLPFSISRSDIDNLECVTITVDERQITRDLDYSNNVFEYVFPESISINNIDLVKRSSAPIHVNSLPSSKNGLYHWTIVSGNCIYLDEWTGMVEAKQVGTSIVQAESLNGLTTQCTVRVFAYDGAEYSDFDYSVNDEGISILGYYGDQSIIEIPQKIAGKTVTSIENIITETSQVTTVIIKHEPSQISNLAFGETQEQRESVHIQTYANCPTVINYASSNGISFETITCGMCQFSEWEKIVNQSCLTQGLKKRTCSICGFVETEPIAATGHSFGKWEKLNDSQHQRICNNDISHVEIVNHKWNAGAVTKPATCKATGIRTYTCTDCGATKTETIQISAGAHSLTYVPAKNATTEAEGNIAYYHCSLCGKNFSDQNGTQQLTKVTTDKLPKQDEPQKNYNNCKYCGEKHTGAFGWLIKLIHSILAAFGMRK